MTTKDSGAITGDGGSANLDDLIDQLYRDIAEWSVEVADLTTYGPTLVQRSVHHFVDEHVKRLRRYVLETSPLDDCAADVARWDDRHSPRQPSTQGHET